MPKGWSAKDERMVNHIKDSGASDVVAFATVNKFRSKRKKKRSRG
jgi:hypothetical protein